MQKYGDAFSKSSSIFWGIWGETELILRIWGAKEKYFQGAEEFSFRTLGRSMHYFQGSREHRPPASEDLSLEKFFDCVFEIYESGRFDRNATAEHDESLQDCVKINSL